MTSPAGPCREFVELRREIELLRGGFQSNVDTYTPATDAATETRRSIYAAVVADLDELLATADRIAGPNPEQENR